jgi:hypothetical protein
LIVTDQIAHQNVEHVIIHWNRSAKTSHDPKTSW